MVNLMSRAKPRILLVDDDPMNLFLLEEILADENYTILTASSGREALAIAAESIPDLILLDVMMPEMDGFEVCQKLRQDDKLQTVSVIFLTALDDQQSRLRGLEMMGDDYLTKPINSELLLAKITNVLRLNKIRSQQSRQQVIAAWQVNDYISEKFRLFVPEQYLERIAPQGVESIRLGNAREEEITVLFCDIRGFTAIAESQSAMETFKWLNVFFSQMSQAVTNAHGFIDKFLGDAILAIFDQPQQHAADAINAALAMQQCLKEFNRDRNQYHLESPINIGIGIHTGNGLIGTVGSAQRMDSTVIGDVVNTAARLEELTKIYKCAILTSHTTLAHVRDRINNNDITNQICSSFESRWVDRITPRGKQQALDLYEIVAQPEHQVDVSALFT